MTTDDASQKLLVAMLNRIADGLPTEAVVLVLVVANGMLSVGGTKVLSADDRRMLLRQALKAIDEETQPCGPVPRKPATV